MTTIISQNYSFGQKCYFLNIAQKILLFAAEICCCCCFNTKDTQEKMRLLTFAGGLEPLFVTNYLELQKSTCIQCKVPEDSESDSENEKNGSIQGQKLEKNVGKPLHESERRNLPPQRPPPQTRRWGVKSKKVAPPVLTNKKSPHLCMWTAFIPFLEENRAKFTSYRSSVQPNGPDTVFLLRLLDFLKTLLMSYTGIAEMIYPIVPDGNRLINLNIIYI